MTTASMPYAPPPPAATGVPCKIAVDMVEPCSFQPRRYFDQNAIEALATSIHDVGQQQPIRVRLHPKTPGRYVIVDGERRWRAHKYLQKLSGKAKTIEAVIVKVVDPDDHFKMSVVSNLFRQELTPVEEAASIARLCEQHTIEVVSRIIGRSKAHVCNYLQIFRLPDEVKELMNPGLGDKCIKASLAMEIYRATSDPQKQIEIARRVSSEQLSLTNTRNLIHEEKTTGVAPDEVKKTRHPADGFRLIETFLRNMSSRANDILTTVDVDKVYGARDTEKADRLANAGELRRLSARLLELADKISKTE